MADDAATGECVGVSGVAVERCGDAGQPVFWADDAAAGVRVGLLKPRAGGVARVSRRGWRAPAALCLRFDVTPYSRERCARWPLLKV